MGGPSIPSLGFGMGLERLLLLIKAQGVELPAAAGCELYIASIGERASVEAAALASELRSSGISAQFDVVGRSVKAQMKYADKIGAKYTIVLGDDDLEKGEVSLKNMDSGETQIISLVSFADDFMEVTIKQATRDLQDALAE
jgi:histidyl-tRNA synthetase